MGGQPGAPAAPSGAQAPAWRGLGGSSPAWQPPAAFAPTPIAGQAGPAAAQPGFAAAVTANPVAATSVSIGPPPPAPFGGAAGQTVPAEAMPPGAGPATAPNAPPSGLGAPSTPAQTPPGASAATNPAAPLPPLAGQTASGPSAPPQAPPAFGQAPASTIGQPSALGTTTVATTLPPPSGPASANPATTPALPGQSVTATTSPMPQTQTTVTATPAANVSLQTPAGPVTTSVTPQTAAAAPALNPAQSATPATITPAVPQPAASASPAANAAPSQSPVPVTTNPTTSASQPATQAAAPAVAQPASSKSPAANAAPNQTSVPAATNQPLAGTPVPNATLQVASTATSTTSSSHSAQPAAAAGHTASTQAPSAARANSAASQTTPFSAPRGVPSSPTTAYATPTQTAGTASAPGQSAAGAAATTETVTFSPAASPFAAAIPANAPQASWQAWGLADAAMLAALADALTGGASAAPAAATTAAAPGVIPSIVPGVAAAPGPATEAAALQRIPPNGVIPAAAVGLAAVATAAGPLLVAMTQQPDDAKTGPGQFALGGGLALSLVAGSSVLPSHVAFTWDGAGAGAMRELAGHAMQDAASALLRALAQAGGGEVAGVALRLTLGGAGEASGTVRLADGTTLPFGGAAPATPYTVAAPGTRPAPDAERSTLYLGAGDPAGADDWRAAVLGPYVGHEARRQVKLDLGDAVAGLWRLDDTHGFAALGTGDVRTATRRAKAVLQRLAAGPGRLDQLAAGEGFATFDGSPLSLALAGVVKPAALGIALNETDPPRLEVLRTPGADWVVARSGGAYANAPRLRYGALAIDEATLNLHVLFGVPPGADETPPQGQLGEHAASGFMQARAKMEQAAWLPSRNDAARARESWAAIARDWASTLQRLAGGNGLMDRLAPGIAAPAMADLLTDQAIRFGSLAAWHVAQRGQVDVPGLLAALGDDPARQAAVADALARPLRSRSARSGTRSRTGCGPLARQDRRRSLPPAPAGSPPRRHCSLGARPRWPGSPPAKWARSAARPAWRSRRGWAGCRCLAPGRPPRWREHDRREGDPVHRRRRARPVQPPCRVEHQAPVFEVPERGMGMIVADRPHQIAARLLQVGPQDRPAGGDVEAGVAQQPRPRLHHAAAHRRRDRGQPARVDLHRPEILGAVEVAHRLPRPAALDHRDRRQHPGRQLVQRGDRHHASKQRPVHRRTSARSQRERRTT